eukprot:2483661-Prymnesium_polylepis.2
MRRCVRYKDPTHDVRGASSQGGVVMTDVPRSGRGVDCQKSLRCRALTTSFTWKMGNRAPWPCMLGCLLSRLI